MGVAGPQPRTTSLAKLSKDENESNLYLEIQFVPRSKHFTFL